MRAKVQLYTTLLLHIKFKDNNYKPAKSSMSYIIRVSELKSSLHTQFIPSFYRHFQGFTYDYDPVAKVSSGSWWIVVAMLA